MGRAEENCFEWCVPKFLLLSLTHFFFFFPPFFFQKSKLLRAKCVAGDAEKSVAVSTPPSMSVGEFGAAALKVASKNDARFAESAPTVEIDGIAFDDISGMWEACDGAEEKIVVVATKVFREDNLLESIKRHILTPGELEARVSELGVACGNENSGFLFDLSHALKRQVDKKLLPGSWKFNPAWKLVGSAKDGTATKGSDLDAVAVLNDGSPINVKEGQPALWDGGKLSYSFFAAASGVLLGCCGEERVFCCGKLKR